MRLSTTERAHVSTLPNQTSLAKFIAQIDEETTEADRNGGILLVGGVSAMDLVVAAAQSPLRLDRLPSYWSHAALILKWPQGAAPKEIVGVEASLAVESPDRRVPERNGVTTFRMSRYADVKHYPNMAFATLSASGPEYQNEVAQLSEKIIDAATHPNRERLRYRLWDWLAPWTAHALLPQQHPNPLNMSVPLPSAALCEYAYEAAGIDLTPGATDPNTCPELLWSMFLYWYDQIQESAGETAASPYRLRIWSVVRSQGSLARQPVSADLSNELV